MYQKVTLDNGLRILTSPMPHTRSVSTGFFITVGSRFEEEKEGGLSHFIEHMLFKGTEKRPQARDIAESIEGVGGVINASTSLELTAYWAKVPEGHLPSALDVLVDMLRHPLLLAEEMEMERRVIMEEIKMMFDDPADWVHLLLNQLVWPHHPLGREVAGTKESVSGIDKGAMLRYLGRHYRPQNTVVTVAGHIDGDEVVDVVAEALGDWKEEERASFLPAPEEGVGPKVCIGRRETEQAQLALSLPGIPYTHPHRFDMRLLNAILGEGMSSRLFLEVREKRGLAYSIHSYVSSFHDTGTMGISAGVDPQRMEAALEAILGELDRLREGPVPPQELRKAKEFVKGRLLLRMEDSFAVASWLGQQEALEDQVLTLDEALASLEAVTAEGIQRLAQERFSDQKISLAVVGPFEEGEEDRFKGLLRF